MKFIIAKKLDMTQRFQEDGTVVPVTLLKADPCVVTQVRTEERDGYSAIQVGCRETKKGLNKPQAGHLKKVGKKLKVLHEFRSTEGEYAVGDTIEVSTFEAGEFVQVSGVSKGKGFQGVVKRHGFRGSPASHGHKDQLRMGGSIGATGPAHVFKGVRMPGRMGGENVTTKNLQIVDIDVTKGIIAVKGAVPGPKGGTVYVAGGYDRKRSWK